MGTLAINKKKSAGEEHQAVLFPLFRVLRRVLLRLFFHDTVECSRRKQFHVVFLLLCLRKKKRRKKNCNIDITTDLSKRSRG
jgi:hypothetical protein